MLLSVRLVRPAPFPVLLTPGERQDVGEHETEPGQDAETPNEE